MAEMTPQKALKVIDKAHDYPCPYGIGGTAWLYIRSCIEKQIPKKPIPEREKCLGRIVSERIVSFTCPNCKSENLGNNEFRYPCCEECGQALDWSDTE